MLDTFAMLRDALSSGYGDALGAYVISGAAAPSDVLEVLLLMKETGLAAVGGTRAALPIVPLFEYGESLRDAAERWARCWNSRRTVPRFAPGATGRR